jgi:hypothetical protein
MRFPRWRYANEILITSLAIELIFLFFVNINKAALILQEKKYPRNNKIFTGK